MASVDNIRNTLISKILRIKDTDMLKAIDKLLVDSVKGQKVDLTEEQILMLKMSDEDIKHGRIISQKDLFKRERHWLNEQ